MPLPKRVMTLHKNPELSTRKRILTLLKTKGSLSVNELSGFLGITEMAVRRHLNRLAGDGYIETTLQRQAMGRPIYLYALTPLAEQFFPKNYHGLTLDLLSELEEEDRALVDRLFERRKRKLEEKHIKRMNGCTLKEKVEQLAQIQNEAGYMVQVEQTSERDFVLNEYNCPISQVASRYEQACNCELDLFRSLLGTNVERTECLAKGGQKCTYKIYAQ